jgi:CheY-like chemotaxis protein
MGQLWQSQQRQRTVLHLENHPANASIIEQLISRRTDLKLIGATTASQCLHFALSGIPDVILMEPEMPGMDGLELVAVLRHGLATAHIPIIALSTNAFPNRISDGMKAGLFRYLTKPFRFAELLKAIDDALLCGDALIVPTATSPVLRVFTEPQHPAKGHRNQGEPNAPT